MTRVFVFVITTHEAKPPGCAPGGFALFGFVVSGIGRRARSLRRIPAPPQIRNKKCIRCLPQENPNKVSPITNNSRRTWEHPWEASNRSPHRHSYSPGHWLPANSTKPDGSESRHSDLLQQQPTSHSRAPDPTSQKRFSTLADLEGSDSLCEFQALESQELATTLPSVGSPDVVGGQAKVGGSHRCHRFVRQSAADWRSGRNKPELRTICPERRLMVIEPVVLLRAFNVTPLVLLYREVRAP